MRNALAALLLTTMTSGCYVYGYDSAPPPNPGPGPGPVIVNSIPIVYDGYAGVYWDEFYYDDIWVFEAEVDDPDGALDIVAVFADVYDERTGQLVETFELYPTEDPFYWYSDWYGSSTFLDPFYPNYTVDIIAYDSFDDFDFVTVWADTY